jgi:CMP-N,N'-diacetyllegionaminic acid synthase
MKESLSTQPAASHTSRQDGGIVYALILARSGSKAVPGKNVRPIGSHPLFAYSIAFAKKLRIDRIIVSTDSPDYRQIALSYGAECPYLRGAKASSDTAIDEDILTDLAENLPKHGVPMPDIWVRLKPTTPFRSVRSVETALVALQDDPTLDSVRIVSVTEARIHVIDSEGFLAPLSPTWDPTRSVILRSEFPRAYKPFNLHVFRHKGWEERGAAYMGRRIKPIIEHKITGIDIDDEDDFDLVKTLIEAKPRPAFLQRFVHEPS